MESAGLGHITRQCYLAPAVRNAFAPTATTFTFIIDGAEAAADFVRRRGFQSAVRPDAVDDAVEWLRERWKTRRPDLFILDSVTTDCESSMKDLLADCGIPSFVVMDDPLDRDVRADLTLNALPGEMLHSNYSGARIRGAEYMIQDKTFAEFHDKQRSTREVPRTGFAFFGGFDGNDFTSVLLDAIEQNSHGLKWRILVGSMHPRAAEFSRRIQDQRLPVTILRDVPSVAEELWSADVAVLNSGNSLSEAVAVGTPAIAFSQLDIQAINAEYFAKRTGVITLGGVGAEFPYPMADGYPRMETRADVMRALHSALGDLIIDNGARQRMRERMLALVDGRGAERVAGHLVNMVRANRTPD